MPTTKEDVLKQIEEIINPGGNNKAVDVHKAFQLVLDLIGDNTPNGENLETFESKESGFLQSITDTEISPNILKKLELLPVTGEMKYSFRGITKHSVNFTFLLRHTLVQVQKEGVRTFFFELPDELETILTNDIFFRKNFTVNVPMRDKNGNPRNYPQKLNISTPLAFTVPLTTGGLGVILRVLFFEQYFVLILDDLDIEIADEGVDIRIHTSLQLHNAPSITFDEAINLGQKSTGQGV